MRLLFIALLLSLMSACSIPERVIFLNSSGHDIVIMYNKEGREFVSLPVKQGEKIETTLLLARDFLIRSQSIDYEYTAEEVPGNFISDLGFGPFLKRIVKAKIEADMCVYLIAENDDFSVEAHGKQPDNFPLCPRVR